jgi:hypothetical protein
MQLSDILSIVFFEHDLADRDRPVITAHFPSISAINIQPSASAQALLYLLNTHKSWVNLKQFAGSRGIIRPTSHSNIFELKVVMLRNAPLSPRTAR